MVEQSKGISTQTVLVGLFGIAIGGLLVYWLLKNKNPNMVLHSQQSNSDPNLNSLGSSINTLQQKIDTIELKLGQMQPPIQEQQQLSQISQTQQPIIQAQPIVQTENAMTQIQENEEECILKTDEKGRIVGFTTHRKLFSNAQNKR